MASWPVTTTASQPMFVFGQFLAVNLSPSVKLCPKSSSRVILALCSDDYIHFQYALLIISQSAGEEKLKISDMMVAMTAWQQ